MNKTLSVIVPIYNVKPYLRQCLDSIINQMYENLDIILVDDGSTDLSGEIADEYKKDARVKVIHKKNEGLMKARLDGVRKAQGEYITFVDADDWIEQNMYADMMQQIVDKNLDMILCGMNRFYSNDKSVNSMPLLGEGLYAENTIKNKVIPCMLWDKKKERNSLDASLCSKIIKRDILIRNLEEASQLDLYLGEDAVVLFPAMLEIKKMYVMHNVYYYHRQRENGIIAPYIQDTLYFEKLFQMYQYLRRRFEQNEYADILLWQLENFYMKFMSVRKGYLGEIELKTEAIFPFTSIRKDSRVVIYGAGNVGQAYMKQNSQYHFCEVVLWADKNYCKYDKTLRIVSPEEIANVEYDYIVIAVQIAGMAEVIKKELLAQGVLEEKIVWKATKTQSF